MDKWLTRDTGIVPFAEMGMGAMQLEFQRLKGYITVKSSENTALS